MSATKTKPKIKVIKNITFIGAIETIKILKNSYNDTIDFFGESEGENDLYFSLEISEVDEFISAIQSVKQQNENK